MPDPRRRLYKRHEVKAGKTPPPDFELADSDPETGKAVGWLPVGDGPEDRWHRDALPKLGDGPEDGTYELLGPKVQGNPEDASAHILVRHGDPVLRLASDPPREFAALRDWLAGRDMEGIVFHHPDGRMAKIKLRDFGWKRPASARREA